MTGLTKSEKDEFKEEMVEIWTDLRKVTPYVIYKIIDALPEKEGPKEHEFKYIRQGNCYQCKWLVNHNCSQPFECVRNYIRKDYYQIRD